MRLQVGARDVESEAGCAEAEGICAVGALALTPQPSILARPF